MSTARSQHQDRREPVATLVRSVAVRLIDVSRGGCRLECASRIEAGTSGQLAVQLAGFIRIDDVRVARCQPRMGAGSVYQLGAELLGTRRLGRRTVRMAVRHLISDGTGVSHVRQDRGAPVAVGLWADEVGGRSDGRAPPVTIDRGS